MIAAICARKSNDQSPVADEAKIRRQIEHSREYAQRKDWNVDDAHV